MTRDEVLARFVAERATLDAHVVAIGPAGMSLVPPGREHSAAQILAHITAYERLIVERLRASRAGVTTAFERDRVGWREFNERVWEEARDADSGEVLHEAREVFGDLLAEVRDLTDDELAAPTGATTALDPAWLDGRAPWELLAIDGFDHYPKHYAALNAARAAAADA